MQVRDYLGPILDAIASNPYVESQNISFEERPPHAFYITGIITFIDGSKLNIKEFLIFKDKSANIVKYGYNYLSGSRKLIFRYDNALDPKAKNLSTYPDHKHISKELLPAKRPTIDRVLREITELIKQRMKR